MKQYSVGIFEKNQFKQFWKIGAFAIIFLTCQACAGNGEV